MFWGIIDIYDRSTARFNKKRDLWGDAISGDGDNTRDMTRSDIRSNAWKCTRTNRIGNLANKEKKGGGKRRTC